jgi:hypothetical protein
VAWVNLGKSQNHVAGWVVEGYKIRNCVRWAWPGLSWAVRLEEWREAGQALSHVTLFLFFSFFFAECNSTVHPSKKEKNMVLR